MLHTTKIRLASSSKVIRKTNLMTPASRFASQMTTLLDLKNLYTDTGEINGINAKGNPAQGFRFILISSAEQYVNMKSISAHSMYICLKVPVSGLKHERTPSIYFERNIKRKHYKYHFYI